MVSVINVIFGTLALFTKMASAARYRYKNSILV